MFVTRKDFVDHVLAEIGLEVERARTQWGAEFDRRNTLNDWVAYTTGYLADAISTSASMGQQEEALRKAAGLLVSALVMLKTEGFAPRHYEGQTAPKSLPEVK
jgi:hypothetical protein